MSTDLDQLRDSTLGNARIQRHRLTLSTLPVQLSQGDDAPYWHIRDHSYSRFASVVQYKQVSSVICAVDVDRRALGYFHIPIARTRRLMCVVRIYAASIWISTVT